MPWLAGKLYKFAMSDVIVLWAIPKKGRETLPFPMSCRTTAITVLLGIAETHPFHHLTRFTATDNNSIYAYNLPRQIGESSSTVTVVDGSIGLNQILHQDIITTPTSMQAANDASGYRITEVSQGAADSHHPLSNRQLIGVAQFRSSETLGLDLYHRQVGERVTRTHQAGRFPLPVE